MPAGLITDKHNGKRAIIELVDNFFCERAIGEP